MGNLSALGFDANEVEPNTFKPVPNGWYKLIVVDSDYGPNKQNTGSNLFLEFEVLEGEHKGKKVRKWLCLEHPKATVQEIAKAQFSGLCRAISVLAPNDSAELHDKPFMGYVAVKKRDDNGEDTNELTKIRSIAEHREKEEAKPATGDDGTPF